MLFLGIRSGKSGFGYDVGIERGPWPRQIDRHDVFLRGCHVEEEGGSGRPEREGAGQAKAVAADQA